MLRLKTIKLIEKNIGSKISDISLSSIFSATSPQARETKDKINKWDYIKPKHFCTAKETISKRKRQPAEGEHKFTDTSDNGLISKIYKELIKLNTKNPNNPIKK